MTGMVLAALFHGPPAASTSSEQDQTTPFVTLRSSNDLALNEESVLLDPTPLFLPTKWNATQREAPPRGVEGRFQGFDAPTLTFAENDMKLALPESIHVPADPAEAVTVPGPAAILGGFGRQDTPMAAPPGRGAFIEIVRARSRKQVWAQSINEIPPAGSAWQPLEFLARVDASGLVGPLVLTTRSGIEAVDRFFADYVIRTFKIGDRLEPGDYQISVGP